MATFRKTLKVKDARLAFIDKALNSTDMMGEDDTITETVTFDNGYQVDIKCCGAQDDEAWTEAVLFDPKGNQVSYTDPSDRFTGKWYLADDRGNTYIVTVQ